MENLIRLSYWFNLRPDAMGNVTKVTFATYIILLAALFTFLKIMKNKGYNSKMWVSITDFAFTNILLACLLMFFSLEYVPFFAAKFWLLVWLAEMILWATIIYKRIKKNKLKQIVEGVDETLKKYIPR